MSKPPIGVMPERIWNDKHPYPSRDDVADRIQALEAALSRYYEDSSKTSVVRKPAHLSSELELRRGQLKNW